jgi:FkbM family methyltransferase
MRRLAARFARLLSTSKFFQKLGRKIDSICFAYHQSYENFNYDHNSNGERWLLKTLAGRNLLKNAFDVGTNRGDWTALVLESNPQVIVHCFEVCPPTFEKLSARFSKDRRVVLNPTGLSDSQGEIEVEYCPDSDGISSIIGGEVLNLMAEVSRLKNIKTIKAKIMRGKDYCAALNITTIDYLKIDAEGADHLVLRGFDDWLTPSNVPVVQFEYGMVGIITRFLLKDFYNYFESRGYKVGKLFPTSVRFREYRFMDEDFRGPNYIAASPEIVNLLNHK